MLPPPEKIANIKGFLDEQEGRRLYALALEASRRGPCLEVGSYCGKSTVYLASACRQTGSTVFAVDHHRGSEEQQAGEPYFDPDLFDPRFGVIDSLPFLRKTLESTGLQDFVVPLVCRSETAARSWRIPLGLLFIDGGHCREDVFTDYRLWSPHIMAGGYLLFHDIYTDPGQGGQAPRQVYGTALESGLYEQLPMTRTLGVLQRKERSDQTCLRP
ncbi:MAG: hypothetical protein AMJ54_11805 [Deltaproteobacteria bacterium SG8_13]|nr:MAG: hypothetical protein AMJ54_11805 [Deltaproteobacteria bacterium SG8_13]